MPDGGPGVSRCFWCEEPVLDGELVQWIPHLGGSGPAVPMPWHVECFARSIIGGVNHLNGTCSCCFGGADPPDPVNMTRREAAIAAFKFYGQFTALSERNISRAIHSDNESCDDE